MTINAARALGLAHEVGSIAAGKAADLCVWRVESLAELGYWIGLPGPGTADFRGSRQLTPRQRSTRQQPPHPRAPRKRDHGQKLGDRSGRPNADEQSRRRGRRGSAEPGRLWRHRPRRAQLGNASTRSSRRSSGSRKTRPCSSSRASRSASSRRTRTRRACSSPTPTSCPNGRTGRRSTSSIAPGS